MPSIKCTAKLATRAGLSLSPPSENTSDDWHANIFTVDRRFYIIFCEDRSRLTCLAGPVQKADLQDLAQVLRNALMAVLSHEGFSETSIQYALSKIEAMSMAKTNNRSVLGTINDNIFHIETHAYQAGGVEGIYLPNLAATVNHMPMSPLKWKYAIEEYRRSLIHSAS
jgi:hypothetical protein